jgi:hypothetical protein
VDQQRNIVYKYGCAEPLRALIPVKIIMWTPANKNVQLDVDTGEQIVEEDQE